MKKLIGVIAVVVGLFASIQDAPAQNPAAGVSAATVAAVSELEAPDDPIPLACPPSSPKCCERVGGVCQICVPSNGQCP